MTALQKRLHAMAELLDVFGGRVRARLLVIRGAELGRKSRFGPRYRVERPFGLHIGQRFVAESDVYLKLVTDDARLTIGDFTFVGRGTEFDVMTTVTIGSHTVIAPNCFITDHNHGTKASTRIDEQPCTSEAVIIGSDVWLGTQVVVLPGVHIGNGAIVGACSVVTRDVPPMTIVTGIPARPVRVRH